MKHLRKRQIKAAKKNRLRHMDTIDLSEIIDIPKGFYVLKRKSSNGNRYIFRVIAHGNCMICGKELTDGLFLCKECENKGENNERRDC